MNIVKSDEYRAAGAEAAKILLKEQHFLDEQEKIRLTILAKRARVLRQVEAATGLRFDVDLAAPKGVAGYMVVATKKVFITEETLDNADWAKYVGRHESMHVHTGDCHLDFEKNLPKEQYAALKDELMNSSIAEKEINWVEGFNDLKTIEAHGQHENSGYLKKEVPAAEKLDDLCIKTTGKSLLEAFGNRELFLSRLRQFTDILLLQNTIEKLRVFDGEGKEIPSLQAERVKRELWKRLPTKQIAGQEDAENIIQKTFLNIAEIARLRKSLGLEVTEDQDLEGIQMAA